MMPYLMNGSPCYVCHNKGDHMIELRLRQMEETCQMAGISKSESRHNYMWGIHSHCRYGLSCSDLEQFDRECETLARNVEPYITGLAEAYAKDEKYATAYHEVLDLCRGYFPAVYRQLEMIHGERAKA